MTYTFHDFASTHKLFRVERHAGGGDLEGEGYPGSIDTEVDNLDEAHVVSSMRNDDGDSHDLVLDIDLPAIFLNSSTPDHHHLLVRLPDGITALALEHFMRAAAEIGLIEQGYADVARKRGHADVRLPWIKKGGEHDFIEPEPDPVEFVPDPAVAKILESLTVDRPDDSDAIF